MLVKLYGASDQPVVRLHNPQLDDWAHRAPREGDGLVVVGWGDTDPGSGEEHSVLASVLREATVNYVPNDQCEDAKGYSSIQSASSATKAEDYFEYDGTISADMMCARGDGEVVQDACQGDSGGGLLRLGADFNGEEGRWCLPPRVAGPRSMYSLLTCTASLRRCANGHRELGPAMRRQGFPRCLRKSRGAL
jgi:hypothetical protein